MSDFQIAVVLIDENAHPCVYAGFGYVEPEAAIILGATMIGAGHQAARMDGRRISVWQLIKTLRQFYTEGLVLAPYRQPEDQWKERRG